MPTLQELEAAIIKADQAGDTQAARMLASEITRIMGQRSVVPANQQTQNAAAVDQWLQQNRLGKEPFSPTRMVRNIPSSTVKLVKDTVGAFLNPKETTENLGKLVAGVAHKIAGTSDRSSYVPPTEQMVDQVRDYYKERYGTMKGFAKALEDDPAGVTSDLSMVLTGGGMAAGRLPGAAGQIGRDVAQVGAAIDPLNLARTAVARPAVGAIGAMIPERTPLDWYQRAAKFPPKAISDDVRDAITRTALREGVAPTHKGLQKLEGIIKPLEEKLSGLIKGATERGDVIHADNLLKYFSDAKKKYEKTLEGTKKQRLITQMEQQFRDQIEASGRFWMTPEEVQRFKVDAYNNIRWDLRGGKSIEARDKARRAAARAAKEEMEFVSPEIRPTNQQLSDLYALEEQLQGTAGRVGNLNPFALSTGMNIGGGAAAGGALGGQMGGKVGAAMGAGATLLNQPGVQSALAQGMYGMQQTPLLPQPTNLPSMPILGDVMPTLIRQTAAETGQLEDFINQ